VFFKFAKDLLRAYIVLNIYKVLIRDRTKDIGVDFSKESRLFAIVVTDLIIAVVILLERNINRLVVEAREVLELVEL
jgi:hypothetical protein